MLPSMLYTSFNYTHLSDYTSRITHFLADRSIFALMSDWTYDFGAWLSQPYFLAIVMAWWITFIVVLLLLSIFLGFNPVGIGGGTFAAAFQSCMYGGFTPAGGVFATLTSLGMLGWMIPVHTGVSAVFATAVALVVWACGIAR
ncbi:MAG: hypothetical protein LQ339_008538 [Xanthoria mediterranea]|nr:MAG: hypothetical protein LQ339_008538 [Xanthoria mediterranea]